MRLQYIIDAACAVVAGGACLLLQSFALPAEVVVLGALLLACLLGIGLILGLIGRWAWLPVLPLVVAAVGALAAFGAPLFPFAAVLAVQVAGRLAPGRAGMLLGGTAVLLAGLVLWPPRAMVLATILAAAPVLVIQFVVERLQAAQCQLAQRAEEADALRKQLENQRRMAKSMEHAARLSERNRLAARLHDQVGHGVSGSVVLLEGAMLAMETDPAAARQAMAVAAQNLRTAVDGIRAALREERAGRGQVNLAHIAARLSRFEAEHPGVRAGLSTEGEMGEISPLVWRCIDENLTEALTNLLKHSAGDRFSVSIAVQNMLTRVVFRDNGPAADFKPGMGLAAMEERCALCNGRCFFQAGPGGFAIAMVFTRPRPEQLQDGQYPGTEAQL